jgi:rRNA maturation endonuclease Nob1
VTSMSQMYILDTNVLVSNWTTKHPEAHFVTTPSIMDEIKNRPSINRTQALLAAGRLEVIEPTSEHIAKVHQAARTTRDGFSLSTTDIELLACALGVTEAGSIPTVVSSDLALLNTANYLGLSILDPSGRMKKQIQWEYICPACQQRERDPPRDLECPVCGTVMKRKSRKQSSLTMK